MKSALLSQIRKLEAKLEPLQERRKEIEDAAAQEYYDLSTDPTVGPPDNAYMKSDRMQTEWQSKAV